MKLTLVFLSFLGTGFCFASPIMIGDASDTVPPIVLEDTDGNSITSMYISIDLDRYVTIPQWEVDQTDCWLNVSYIPMGNVITPTMEVSRDGSRSLANYVTWVDGTGECSDTSVGLPYSAWDIGHNIWLHLKSKDCGIKLGQANSFYWKYWANCGDYNTIADQKTISGAIMDVIGRLQEDLMCNSYCISLSKGEAWLGTLVVGPTSTAWRTLCVGAYTGGWNNGCYSLNWPCSCWS